MVTATTIRVSDWEEKAVSDEVAFASVKSGEWDFAMFKDWQSQKCHEAYTDGIADSRYYVAAFSRDL